MINASEALKQSNKNKELPYKDSAKLLETFKEMLNSNVLEAVSYGEDHTGILWKQVLERLQINPREITPATVRKIKEELMLTYSELGYTVQFQSDYSILLSWLSATASEEKSTKKSKKPTKA